MKIKCILPSNHHLRGVDSAIERSCNPIVPVIIFLDSKKLLTFLRGGDFPFNPNAARLAKTKGITTSNWLELPIIIHNGIVASFIDGRHRTTALAEAGLATIPFLTAQPMMQTLLATLGGSQATGISTYSFAECGDYPTYGIQP